MNEISIINKSTLLGREINVYGSAENPLFKAKDVAGWLDIQNVSDMIKNIDPEEKVLDSIYTLGGTQEAWLVTEDGLYEILMQSRKPIPNQQYIEKGIFELKKGIRSGNDGVIVNTITTKVTPKGQQYFILKFLHS